MRKTVVTGLGVMSPFGAGVKAYWAGLAAGACAIRPLTLFEATGFRCGIAGEVPEIADGSPRRSRADRLALTAAGEALTDAGLDAGERRETALVVGAVGGGMFEAEAWYWARARRPAGRPTALRTMLPGSHAAALAHRLRLKGPCQTVVTACSSGAVALAEAADLVAEGVVDVAVAGGIDALTRLCFMGFNALKLLDPEPCRPFDRDRRGMSIGEGAAFVVIEAEAHARARGARIYAELGGHAMTTDAFHVTSPHPDGEGMARAMQGALDDAGVPAAAVGYVNAHGTATPQNDRIEAQAITRVFDADRVLVSSTKSMIGHAMAASGSLEAVATILSLVHDLLPPTASLVTPGPEVAFDCLPGAARETAVECAISNSFGFGGQNVTLLFRRA
jgi:3-oxoacyl-[acyl-carrier-protein] synthase II